MLKSNTRYPQSIIAVIVVVLGLVIVGSNNGVSAGRTTRRPISDFVNAQGTFCLKFDTNGNVDCSASSYGGSSCDLFVPPQPNVTGWTDPKSNRFALVDYAGLTDDLVGGAFGTTMDGNITELPLSDGRAKVSVILHTVNAFTWVSDLSSGFPGTVLFGHELADVLTVKGADAALGDSLLQLTFTNTAPGAPLPDLIQLIFCPEAGQQLQVISLRSRADGSLRAAFGVPDGTPGRATVSQTGLLVITNKGIIKLGSFPAALINLQVVGK